MNKLLLSLLTTLLIVSCSSRQKVKKLDPKVENRLSEFESRLNEVEKEKGNLYAPETFNTVKSNFKDIEKNAYYGTSYKKINKKLDDNREHLQKIKRSIKLADVHLKDVIKARKRALAAGADEFETFKEADEALIELGENLENKDINDVIENRNNVLNMYHNAQISYLQQENLKHFIKKHEKLNELDGSDAFEKESNEFNKAINVAKNTISKFKDEPKQYASAIEDVEDKFKRHKALVLTSNWIETTPKRELVKTLDKDLNTIADTLWFNEPHFLSYQKKIGHLKDEVTIVPYLWNELSNTQLANLKKNRKLDKLNNKLESKESKLKKKLALQDKVKKIRSLFKSHEAKVMIKNDDIIIQLVGLNFEFDKANLPKDADQILKKVNTSLSFFNYPDIDIKGHADAIGSPIYNQRLAKKRAMSVNEFLVKDSKLNKNQTQIQALGFTRPFAENKTQEGRKLNRRVDIVLNSVIY